MTETALAYRNQPTLPLPALGRAWRALTPAAWLVWFATVLPAALILVAALPALPGDGHWFRFGLLTAAASLAQLGSVRLSRNRVFHPAIMFVLAAVLLLSPEQVVLMCLIQHLGEWLRNRYAWYIQPFNIANYVLAVAASALLFDRLLAEGVSFAAAGALAAVGFIVVNRLLLLVMLCAARQMRPTETGLLRPDDVSLELVLAFMGVPLDLLANLGPVAVALPAAPLVLIYLAQRNAQQLDEASATIRDQNEQLAETAEEVISRSTAALEALSATVDARDAYTAGHSRRVRDIAVILGRALELDQQALETLSQAALLHDIGKIAVPDHVLLKEAPLDRSEWLLMCSHPDQGARIIDRLGYLSEVVPAIRHHHERLDGGGYPDGLRGEAVPLLARIIHVADALDAMLSRRVYRDSLRLADAVAELRRGAGSDFCTACVQAFENALAAGTLDDILATAGTTP
jgi:putative nucleotidyltransferase with HDIG domain